MFNVDEHKYEHRSDIARQVVLLPFQPGTARVVGLRHDLADAECNQLADTVSPDASIRERS